MYTQEILNHEEMFLPSNSGVIDNLIAGYDAEKAKLERFIDGLTYEYRNVLHYFERPTKYMPKFDLDSAMISLNASYWSRALNMTDVFETMPQKRRDEWNKQLSAWREERYVYGKNPEEDLPNFEEQTVRSTLEHLLNMRSTFFAERVDGIFRSLSRTHVTNQPEGFSKRMIIAGVINDWGSVDYSRGGYIRDLRHVVAKFMGRDEPSHRSTDFIIRRAQEQRGEWLSFDAGAMRIRVYKIGTAHLEINPDMAWRLNSVLASLYPMAIPSKFRTKPAKKLKDFEMMQRPLPFKVLQVLQEGDYWDQSNYKRRSYNNEIYEKTINSFDLKLSDNKPANQEALSVLEAIGGVRDGIRTVLFDYDAKQVINEIIVTGCIPDKKSHQFYATPEALAKQAVELADITDNDSCLEPSAGVGGLADHMPKDQTICIEISALHCKVLESKGYKVINDDFLNFKTGSYSKIILNPPFSEGRAKAHIEHALTLLSSSGVLVAILPSSFIGKSMGNGLEAWTPAIHNAFSDVSVSVTIYKHIKE